MIDLLEFQGGFIDINPSLIGIQPPPPDDLYELGDGSGTYELGNSSGSYKLG